MRIIFSAAMIAAGLMATPASAQQVDLSTVTCKDFIGGGQESISYMMMWIDGYYTSEDAKPVMDFDKMKAKGVKLGAYCAANPDVTLTKAAEPIFME